MEEDNNYKKPRWLTANKDFYRNYKYERERLKENMTSVEIKLWEQLKNKKLGIKFRRQHVIDTYIPDFVALSIKLIVEVDGGIHIKKRKQDKERTKWLEILGYKVVRFKNEEVDNDIEIVLERIKKEIKTLTPPNLPVGEGQEPPNYLR